MIDIMSKSDKERELNNDVAVGIAFLESDVERTGCNKTLLQ